MNRFRIFFWGLLMVFPFLAPAQQKTADVYGKIFAPDGSPAHFVIVVIKGQGLKTKSDGDGAFSFKNLSAIHDTLIVSGIGFVPYRQAIEPRGGQSLDLGSIGLVYQDNQLSHVEINGSLTSSYKNDYSSIASKTLTALADVPQSVSTVTKELIDDRMQLHLTNALENVTSVTHYSGYEEFNIRGLHAENPYLINGLRTFNTNLTSPMLANVERMEVIKGPASVLYGNADPGGVINLVTKKPLPQSQSNFTIGSGSWNGVNAQADVTGPINQRGTWLYRLNGGYEDKNSFRHGYFLKNYQIAPSVSFVPNKRWQVNLDVSLSATKSVVDRGQPAFNNETGFSSTPISLSLIQPGDLLKETNFSAALTSSYKINPHITYNVGVLYYLTRQSLSEHVLAGYVTNDSVSLGYNSRNMNTATITVTNNFAFRFKTGRLRHELLAGFDLISTELNADGWSGSLPDLSGEGEGIVGGFSLKHPRYSGRMVNTYTRIASETDDIAEGTYQTEGLYIQDQINFKKWQLLAGIRADFYTAGDPEESDAEVSHINKLIPRIGVTYSFTKNIKGYATYNNGFDPFEPTAVIQVFNEPYKPVNSEMVETGAKADLFNNKLSATLALYQIVLNNVAVNANDPSNPNLFIQRGQERSRGVETEIRGYLLPNLSASFTYAYNVAEISKSTIAEQIGRIKENAPRHSSSSWFKYNFKKGLLKDFGIAAGHTQASIRNTLEQGFTLPGYFILNSGVQYTKGHFLVAMNLNNILNTTYWSSAYNNTSKWPGEPRNFMVRLGFHF